MKVGLSQVNKDAPKWVQRTAAVLALLSVYKTALITDMPLLGAANKIVLGSWYDYLLGLADFLIAILLLFSGRRENNVKRDSATV